MSDQSDSSCLKLMVDLATGDDDDNSKVLMHPLTMKTLKVCDGDIILIKGKKLRDTICRAHVDESCTCKESKIRMNRVVRCNLRVYLGDSVTLHPCPDVKYGKRVHILPIHDSVYDDSFYAVSGNLVKGFLKPYFSEVQAYRPVTKGDVFLVPAMRSVEFKVIQIETEIDIDN